MQFEDINNELFNCNPVSNDGNSISLIVILDHFEIIELKFEIKGIKPHPSADGLNPLIGIDPRVEVLNQYPTEKAELACHAGKAGSIN